MPTNPPGYLKKYYHAQQDAIVKKLGGKCFDCGTTRDLEIHHIHGWKGKPTKGNKGRGMLNRLTDWKREIKHLRLYCEKCHDKHPPIRNDGR